MLPQTRTIDDISARLRTMQRRTIDTVIATGRELADAERKTGKEFETWVQKNTPFTVAAARRFIRVYIVFRDKSDLKNIDLDALYHLASPNISSKAAEYAVKLSRTQRVTFDVARDIVAAHVLPSPLVALSGSLLKIPESRLAIEAGNSLSKSLDNGDSIYITKITETDDESYLKGTRVDANGKVTETTGADTSHVIIKLTGGTFPKKTCRICKTEKEIIKFVRSNSRQDGYESRCLECLNMLARNRNAKKTAKRNQKENV